MKKSIIKILFILLSFAAVLSICFSIRQSHIDSRLKRYGEYTTATVVRINGDTFYYDIVVNDSSYVRSIGVKRHIAHEVPLGYRFPAVYDPNKIGKGRIIHRFCIILDPYALKQDCALERERIKSAYPQWKIPREYLISPPLIIDTLTNQNGRSTDTAPSFFYWITNKIINTKRCSDK